MGEKIKFGDPVLIKKLQDEKREQEQMNRIRGSLNGMKMFSVTVETEVMVLAETREEAESIADFNSRSIFQETEFDFSASSTNCLSNGWGRRDLVYNNLDIEVEAGVALKILNEKEQQSPTKDDKTLSLFENEF